MSTHCTVSYHTFCPAIKRFFQHRFYSRNTYFFRWVNSQSKTDQIFHSFNFTCFIQLALPWIIYIIILQYVSTLSYPLRTLKLPAWLTLLCSNYLELHPSIFSFASLSPVTLYSTSARGIFFTNLSPSIPSY